MGGGRGGGRGGGGNGDANIFYRKHKLMVRGLGSSKGIGAAMNHNPTNHTHCQTLGSIIQELKISLASLYAHCGQMRTKPSGHQDLLIQTRHCLKHSHCQSSV